jgi:hypothetical protein
MSFPRRTALARGDRMLRLADSLDMISRMTASVIRWLALA